MERDCDRLKSRLMKEWVDAAESFDDPLTRIIGSGLLWTGLRIFIFAHLRPDWFFYDKEIEVLKLRVPDSDECHKSPPGKVCGDCRHRGREPTGEEINPKTPAGDERIIEIPREYTCYHTGETRPLQLTDDLLGFFQINDDYGHQQFPIQIDAIRGRVKKVASRADDRMDGSFRKQRGHTPIRVDWKDEPIPDVFPHDLRATLGTQMYRGEEGDDDKATLEQIAAELGHKNIETTRKYADWADEEVLGGGGRRSKK
jgi:integrase